tara:strand:- start:52 stop:423 length:372 start_codon:yes stop_codon:yes gene_type:complete
MRLVLIDDAIRALHPDAQFTTVNEVITEWNSPNITQPTQEELHAKLIELKAAEPARLVREIRDRLLAESDWTQNRDVVLLNDTTWQQYRQDLRDLPASASFTPSLDSNGRLDMSSVTWPTKPS